STRGMPAVHKKRHIAEWLIFICDITKLRVLGNVAVAASAGHAGIVISSRIIPNVVKSHLCEFILTIDINASAVGRIADNVVANEALAEVIGAGINIASELCAVSRQSIIY